MRSILRRLRNFLTREKREEESLRGERFYETFPKFDERIVDRRHRANIARSHHRKVFALAEKVGVLRLLRRDRLR